ncbi:protein quiver [Trichonephila clavata]|uniref:UPAR/Ly6 domain-containing protein qvr n=1 Tax=Trichonephila clavata TaxID=2740835 RepID=A0A8X6I1I9_TRICU|nr:protein quiver [Trichonephila clavata]
MLQLYTFKVVVLSPKYLAEEECLTGKSYWCYECDTWSDPRCHDPFNYSAPLSEHPLSKQCEGCCVKIVTNYSKPNEVVRRTCTKNIHINLFMVDHVCMYEGHKIGHMCFCEGDHCNAGPSISLPTLTTIFPVIACYLMLRRRMMLAQL